MKKVYGYLKRKLASPNKYAKELGVTFGRNCIFNTKQFGSEPYLISIGDNFYSSSNVQFITHDGSVNVLRNLYKKYANTDLFGKIIIGNNVFLGYGVAVLPNSIIGDNVIVGAGSIVKGTIKSNSVYAGVPAKYKMSIEQYLEKNKHLFSETKSLSAKEKENYIKNEFLIS
ncbi:acyltransferase [Kistimonas asteriae]|uniref:acyltransferase n=1 Tax=Kistimonas asteriae TaxID=517724 RepID=UPI001BAE17F0|nr:acyltransferase [Kistimonas asteriae]